MTRVLVRITSSSLPKELVAGRMVGPVNLRMAVHAAAADRPVAGRGDLGAVVNRRRVPAADMAALTEHRVLGDEHAVVVRAVRIVTARATLAACGVIPYERPALLGVAARAHLVE